MTSIFLFAKVNFVTKKTVVALFLLSTFLFVSPVLAVNSTTKTVPKRINPPIEKLEKRFASKEAEVVQRREEIKARIASKAADLKTRLEQFKDQKKAQSAERISNTLNKINKIRTDQMLKHLNLMSTILDKLEARVNQGKPDIKDPTKAKDAIASARGTIASASAAVATQAEKDYTLTATSEAKIKTEAKIMRDKLHTDLQAARKLVISAKQAVANAIRVAKSGKLEIPGKEATESGE